MAGQGIMDTDMRKDKATSEISSTPSVSFRKTNAKPSWLTPTLSDLDLRMKNLALNMPEGDKTDNTFKERAEFYYEKRPQLLALLQDLYNGYIALSDKYIQSVAKQNNHRSHSSLVLSTDNDFFTGQDDSFSSLFDSDAESSVSCHHQPLQVNPPKNIDDIIVGLVMKKVEFDILSDEVAAIEQQGNESSRKIELQKSLLDVLESERLMLMNENAKLCSEMTTLEQERKKLSFESLSMRKKANEMAKLLLKMRDEQKLCMLRKIDDLQGKVQTLEKENEYFEQLVSKECYEALVNKEYFKPLAMKHRNIEEDKRTFKKKESKRRKEVNLKIGFDMKEDKKKNASSVKYDSGKKSSKWWGKVINIKMFQCGCQPSSPMR